MSKRWIENTTWLLSLFAVIGATLWIADIIEVKNRATQELWQAANRNLVIALIVLWMGIIGLSVSAMRNWRHRRRLMDHTG